MSKNMCRMIGLIFMIVSVFPILGGLYLGEAGLPEFMGPASLLTGIALLIIGIVFYKILKSD